MVRTEILPGVMLTAVQSEKFKTGCFSLNLLRPLCREEAAKNALTFSVLLRGTRKYPDMQSLSAVMDELYGTEIGLLVRKKGEVQASGLYADFVEDDLLEGESIFSSVVELAARMLLEPRLENGAFLPEYVEREKENLIHSIRSRINSKRSYAAGQMVKAMCRGEAYGVDRVGEEEDVLPITAESLYEHYLHMLKTSRVEILYMGRKSPDTVESTFRDALKDLPRGELVSLSTQVVKAAKKEKYAEEKLNVTQGKLCMGFRLGCSCTDPGWTAVTVLNAVFGSGVTSKLFLNVREKMSLCYYASSSLEKHKGIMVVSSGIEFDKFDTAKAAILQQLEDCRQGSITEYELESAKKHMISGLRAAKDSPGQLDEYHLGQAVSGRMGTLDEAMEKVAAVTAEEVAQAARNVTLDTVYFLKGVDA